MLIKNVIDDAKSGTSWTRGSNTTGAVGEADRLTEVTELTMRTPAALVRNSGLKIENIHVVQLDVYSTKLMQQLTEKQIVLYPDILSYFLC